MPVWPAEWELLVFVGTVLTGACVGLEYGIVCGAAADVARALAHAARPVLAVTEFKVITVTYITPDEKKIDLVGPASFCLRIYQ